MVIRVTPSTVPLRPKPNRAHLEHHEKKSRELQYDHKSEDIPRLITEAFDSITVEVWKKHCNHVRNLENEY